MATEAPFPEEEYLAPLPTRSGADGTRRRRRFTGLREK